MLFDGDTDGSKKIMMMNAVPIIWAILQLLLVVIIIWMAKKFLFPAEDPYEDASAGAIKFETGLETPVNHGMGLGIVGADSAREKTDGGGEVIESDSAYYKEMRAYEEPEW